MTGGGSRQRTGSASPAENPKQRDPKEIEKMVDEYEGPNAKKTPPVPVPTVPKRLASLQKKNLAKSMKKSNIGKYKVIKPNLKAPKQSKPKNSVEIPLAGEIPIAGTMPATTVAKRPAPQPPKATKASKPAKSTKPAKASKVTFQDKKKDINQPMKPQKLKKQDKKVFKDELTLDSEETSEDEGTTRDVDTNELESSSQASGESSEISESTDDESGSDETSDSEEGKSDESDSELDESESDSASDSDSQEDDEDEDDADSEDEDDEEEGEREPTEEEIIYRQGKKVAIFPDDSSFRKTHGKGVVKHKVELPGIIGYVYGIELNKGVTSRGLNLRLTKKQEKCLSQNMKSWWMLNKSSHCWVEGYRMCDGKLV